MAHRAINRVTRRSCGQVQPDAPERDAPEHWTPAP